MTTPKPVTAYAAVSPDGRIDCDAMSRSEETAKTIAAEWYETETPLKSIPVTVLSTEQYEAMVEVLEWYKTQISACKSYEDAGYEARDQLNKDGGKRASDILAALKEQDHAQ